MLSVVKNLEAEWKPSVICITGDLVWRGAKSDYEEAKLWLDRLLDLCGLGYEKIVICPGNHEVDRKIAGKIPRPSTASEADAALSPPIATHYNSVFAEFSGFCQSCGIPPLKFGQYESSLVGERIVNGIRFVVLNSAWSSKDNFDKGKLWLAYSQIEYLSSEGQYPIITNNDASNITVTLIHHPADHLHEDETIASLDRPNPWDYIAYRTDILLTGHTHGEVRKPDLIANSAQHFTGGATYAGGNYTNSFRIIKVIGDRLTYKPFEYDPRSPDHAWRAHDVRSVPLRAKATSVDEPQASVRNDISVTVSELRVALASDALRQQSRKSRLLRPTGQLPHNVSQEVSVRASFQHEVFDSHGRLLRKRDAEHLMSFYEAIRESRRTLLLGDLGTGKSTLGAQLVMETIQRSKSALAVLVPVKKLELSKQLSPREILHCVNQYIVNEAFPRRTDTDLILMLENHFEVLLVLDGIDELPRDVAARLLQQAAAIPEHWPTIQMVATARPIEIQGVSFAEWRVIHTAPLDEEGKLEFLTAELVADGLDAIKSAEKAKEFLHSLRSIPTLDSLAVSPLTIRLVYPHINSASANPSLTLGDLLYELLILRLGNWQQLDDKPSTLQSFESCFPSPESRIEFLSVLAEKEVTGVHFSREEAVACLTEEASKLESGNKFALATEALKYYEWLGLLVISTRVEFPLQPLAEVAAGANLLRKWKSIDQSLPSKDLWRVVSFAASIARRRGGFAEIREPVLKFLESLLSPNAPNLPASCYVVAESGDRILAEGAVELFASLGMRPLTLFFEDRKTSAQNVAKTLWMAGETGFTYLFQQYLDPRLPLPNAGSAVIQEVVRHWAALARGNLSADQMRRLKKLALPYLATGEANFYGILDVIAVLTPEEFNRSDRLWYQSAAFDGRQFEKWVRYQFTQLAGDSEHCSLMNDIVQIRAGTSERAAEFWLSINSNEAPPLPLILNAFRSLTKAKKGELTSLAMECRERLGDERWMRMARWLLTAEDNNVSTGAAIVLYNRGESRLVLLGHAFLRSLHDGAYVKQAEVLLTELVDIRSDEGVRWLAKEMAERKDSLGAHSGCWRIILKKLPALTDGPEVLTKCVRNMGPFTLARFPEIREALGVLLEGTRGNEFKDALRRSLNSLDPRQRKGAAEILVVTAPATEGQALLTAVQSRSQSLSHDNHEWESFCLSLSFSPGVLALLQKNLNVLSPNSSTFALALLVKGEFEIEHSLHAAFVRGLLEIGNWHLANDPSIRSYLSKEPAISFLLSELHEPESKAAERAAQILRDIQIPLSASMEAKCIVLVASSLMMPRNLSSILIRIEEDASFAQALSNACADIHAKMPQRALLELVTQACHANGNWKDVLWAMFCDDRQLVPRSDDYAGPAILEFGLRFERHRLALGEAALSCVTDPRMQRYRWIDATQWLAVLADEFLGLSPEQIRSALTQGQPIYCAAAAALIARLGEVPAGLHFERAQRKHKAALASNVAGTRADARASSEILADLLDYGRDSESLHPKTLDVIAESLLCEKLSESELAELANRGLPGVFISVALQFCYGHSQNLCQTIPVFDHAFFRKNEAEKVFDRLTKIWLLERDVMVIYNESATQDYLAELDRQLRLGKVWRLPLALQILRIRRSLLPEQIMHVFMDLSKHSSFMHQQLCIEIVTWLCANPDNSQRQAALAAVQAVIAELNNIPWGEETDSLTCCFFAIMHWTLCDEYSAPAEVIFLRGIGGALTEQPPDRSSDRGISKVLSLIEPLLRKVSKPFLRKAISRGSDTPEPALRAFCLLLESLEGARPESAAC